MVEIEAKDDSMSDDAAPVAAATTPDETAKDEAARDVATQPPPAAPGQQKVRFDSANIKSTYCNVCNATSTREEVVINFGVNKTWDQGGQELEVQLEHRIILSPFAAKRLQDMLVRLIAEHEQRYGKLN